jgi:hypothetical protein
MQTVVFERATMRNQNTPHIDDPMIACNDRFFKNKLGIGVGHQTLFLNYLLCRKTGEKNEILTPVGCPLRCGPELMVSVGEGGKLFGRLNTNERLTYDKFSRRDKLRLSILPATKKLKLADPATKSIRSGITAAQGGLFLLLFLPTKKSKRGKPINCVKGSFPIRYNVLTSFQYS